MGYTEDDWKSRIVHRSDITAGLAHLTRDNAEFKVLDVLLNILTEQRLIGSSTDSGFIVGNRRAVCLQESPVYSLAQNIYTEQTYRKSTNSAKVRYLGFGLQFGKRFVYDHGGRPVIYDRTSDAKQYLPDTEWWRIVNLDLSDEKAIIDWTHEREWRVPEELKFPLSEVTVILPNERVYQSFVKKCLATNQHELLTSIRGIVQLGTVLY